MWKGWIIEESLSDAKILSKMKIVNTIREENSEGSDTKIWTIHTVEIEDGKADEIAADLERIIKPEWYFHMTDMKKLIIVFHQKSFKFSVTEAGRDKGTGIVDFRMTPSEKTKWAAAVKYGTGKGKVDPRYIISVR